MSGTDPWSARPDLPPGQKPPAAVDLTKPVRQRVRSEPGELPPVEEDAPREWWDDPRMPWTGKPGRKDLWCWGCIAVLGIYGLATLPLRAFLLGLNTYALAAFSGSNIAMVDIGARLRTGHQPYWWVGLLMAALTSIKFDWIFWWAGRLWGHGIIEVVAGRSRWAARTAAIAERLAKRFGGPAVFLVWFVPFLPSAIVNAFVGDVGMRLRRFLLIDFAAAIVYRGIWMYAGYQIGAPAKDFVHTLSRYSTYLTYATIAIVVVGTIVRSRRQPIRRA
ncbi:VTT domain-containing protein [Allobranchiibius sp. GilTou38]|uniref:DedA family protein n=1 Tax=Allobranchiibius sp. GilTou38 TaxID=2815210 RepID=UPI001AA1157B|nr:VTT domain-containing protein [Allobranchiibius sp. GilTou38]MBO1765248.1 VTT domain-containing protein [Allobranchiibius sp. GilTou38]